MTDYETDGQEPDDASLPHHIRRADELLAAIEVEHDGEHKHAIREIRQLLRATERDIA